MSEEPHTLTMSRAAEQIRARRVSPVELMQACLDRLGALDPRPHADITIPAELALEPGERPSVFTPANLPLGPALEVARRAGLSLDERQRGIRLEAASYALAMGRHLRTERCRFEEPALVLRPAGQG